MLKEKLAKYIAKENLFDPQNDTILLAVSGGIDSVVLADLFYQSKFRFAIAHCNFQLRGQDSDEDAQFVQQLALQFNVPFHLETFNTRKIISEQHGNVQAIARKLRYDWFAQLLDKHYYTYIATAHHIDDSIENVVMNLSKGTGIRGLRGILPKIEHKRLIRPLSFASKSTILEYAQMYAIAHREDSSNAKDDYHRNYVRHHITPRLEHINPSLQNTFYANFQRFRAYEKLLDWSLDVWKKQCIEIDNNGRWTIQITPLLALDFSSLLLYEWLHPFGFVPDQIQQLLEQATHPSGAIIESNSHRLLRDRNVWILDKKQENEPLFPIQIDTINVPINIGHQQLSFELISRKNLHLDKTPTIAYFDLDKLSFPLTLRYWQAADSFCPFGMNGQRKKVSKLLKDHKINRFDKEKTLILTTQNEIMWVVGWRSDERFKLTTTTQQVLKIEIKENL